MFKIISSILIFIVVLIVAIIYSSLEKARNKVKEEYSMTEILLKKRWDIIPDLLKILKNYHIYEESTLEKLAKLRSEKYDEMKIEKRLTVDKNISKVVFKIFEIAESSPEITSDEEFLKLSDEFVKLEEDIKKIRKNYNSNVKEYNKKLQGFPNNIIAILFGFNEKEAFK